MVKSFCSLYHSAVKQNLFASFISTEQTIDYLKQYPMQKEYTAYNKCVFTKELSSHSLEIPNDDYNMLLSQTLIGSSLLSQNYFKLFG